MRDDGSVYDARLRGGSGGLMSYGANGKAKQS